MFRATRYPSKELVTPKLGVNLTDTLFRLSPFEAKKLQNLLYIKDSLVQRGAFSPHSTVDYTALAPFRGLGVYKEPGALAGERLLFATEDGKVYERTSESANTLRHTFAVGSKDVDFTTVFDAVIAMANDTTPGIGRGTTWRKFGSPAAISNLAVTPSGSGSIAVGEYLHMAIAVIESGGVFAVASNWSNVVKTTVSSPAAQFNITFTYPVDSRVTCVLLYRTKVGSPAFYLESRVTSGSRTDSTLDSALPAIITGQPSYPPIQNGAWGVPKSASYVDFSGSRAVLLRLADIQNGIQTSQLASTSFEAEGFPADESTVVRCFKDGPVTGGISIARQGEAVNTNDYFVGQENACYILPETDPANPLQEISSDVGPINRWAIAKFENWVFFQSRRGVELWPGVGKTVYSISDRVLPIFQGGGNQSMVGNQGDAHIKYMVAKDHLWITVRQDTGIDYATEVWCLDLLKFKREFNPDRPWESARFVGPIQNKGTGYSLSFHWMIRGLTGAVYVCDSYNKRLLKLTQALGVDTVGALSKNVPVIVEHANLFGDNTANIKSIHKVDVSAFSQEDILMYFAREYSDWEYSVPCKLVHRYALNWVDIVWSDINWQEVDWQLTALFPFGRGRNQWCNFKFVKESATYSFAYYGFYVWYTSHTQYGVF